jgi:homopolymeric O-antigen transport system permease protein
MNAAQLPVITYTPESPLRHPGRLLREMFHDLAASRELAWRLFVRDTRAQYRQSVLGYLWAFIPPLVTSLPFIFLNSQGVVGIKGTSIPYAAYAMIGTIIWQVFADALTNPLKIVTAAKPMLARINFPREAILLSAFGQVIFSFLVRLVLLIGVFVWFRIAPPLTVFLAPFGVVSLMMVGFMLGLALTPIGILYTDVPQLIPIIAMFFMFLTPVLYPPPQTGLAASLVKWNPLSPLVIVTRDWLVMGYTGHSIAFIAVTAAACALLFAGWVMYRLALPHIVARIGN